MVIYKYDLADLSGSETAHKIFRKIRCLHVVRLVGKVRKVHIRRISVPSDSISGLTATSSVKSALSRMLDEEIIYRAPDGYMVYDRFFGQWLDARF